MHVYSIQLTPDTDEVNLPVCLGHWYNPIFFPNTNCRSDIQYVVLNFLLFFVALASKALLITMTLLTKAGRSRSYPHQILDTTPSGTPLANTGTNNYLLPSPFLSFLSVMTRIVYRRFFKCPKKKFFSIPHLDLQACSFIYISTIALFKNSIQASFLCHNF